MGICGSDLRENANKFFTSDEVFRFFQQGLRLVHRTRHKFERNLLRGISLINLPSRLEVSRIGDQISALESDIERLTKRLTEIRRELERILPPNRS